MKSVLIVMGLLGVTSLSAEELLIKNVRLVETSFQSGKVRDLRIVNGVITQIGADLVASAGAAVFDGEARAVTPGFIDSGTTIGLAEVSGLGVSHDGEQVDDDMTAGFQVYLALNENSSLIPIASNDGITAVSLCRRRAIATMQVKARWSDSNKDRLFYKKKLWRSICIYVRAIGGERGALDPVRLLPR